LYRRRCVSPLIAGYLLAHILGTVLAEGEEVLPQGLYHGVHFYRDTRSLAETVAGFFSTGFRLSRPAVLVATPAHAVPILAELEKVGIHTGELRAAGELQVFDARRMLTSFMVGGQPDTLMFKSNVADILDRLLAGRHPHIYGEMVDLLWQSDRGDAAIKLEILWNQLASAHRFSLMCGYAAAHFPGAPNGDRGPGFGHVCQQHSHAL
jgi:hypothetical protein